MDFIYRKVLRYEPPAQKKRTKPLQVLALGLGRSGTDSLCLALRHLGYETYHGYTTYEVSPRDHLLWKPWLEEKILSRGIATPLNISTEQFDRVLGEYEAVTDAPCAVFGQELIRAYPEAKVILNRRKDVHAWHQSFRDSVYTVVPSRALQFIASFDPLFYFSTRSAYLYCYTYWGGRNFLQSGEQMYKEHYERLEADLKLGTYLNWTVEEGWEPLCKFLGKSVPKTPFPSGNSLKEYEARTNKIILSYLGSCIRNLLMCVAVISATIIGIYKYCIH